MRSRLIFLCSVTLLYASCFSMEQKRGWKLSRGEGEWRLDPESGIRSLTVTGSGDKDESTYWTSEYPFEPGGLYRISCELRAPGGTGDGLALTGSNLVNMAIPAEPEWKAYAFIFTAPQEAGRPVLRFGQYRVRGTVWFRNIEVQAVTPFYRRSGGLALGTGERVQDGVYQAALTYKGTESNSSRCLHAAKGYFNSYRWDLRAGDYVVYCHHPVAGRPVQKSAEVAVNIGYHTGGVCVVEASRDLEQWREIGRIDGKRRSSFALPSGLFPAEAVYIRLRVTGLLARLQVFEYQYRADLLPGVPELEGRTHYLQIEQQPEEYSVEVESVGAMSPGEQEPAVVRITNRSDRPRTLEVAVDRKRGGGTRTVTLRPGASTRLDLPAAPGGSGTLERELEVRPLEGDGPVYRARTEIELPILSWTDYGRLLAVEEGVALWTADGSRKVGVDRAVPQQRGQSIELGAARNEAEAVQLVLRPDRPMKGIKAEATALRGTGDSVIPAEAVRLYRVEYVTVTHPSDAAGAAGLWPDPLPPIRTPLDLEQDRNVPIWIQIHVPRDAVPGKYRGQIVLSNRTWRAEIPVVLRVWAFTLPGRSHLQTAFGLSPQLIRKYHHFPKKLPEAVLDKYYTCFREHRISPYDPFFNTPIKTTVDEENLTVTCDFSDFDRTGRKVLDELGFNSFRLGLEGLGSGTFHSRRYGRIGPFTQPGAGYRAVMSSYLRQVQDHLAEMGWLDEAYVYWFDEPDEKDYDFVNETMALINEAAPRLTRMLTEQPEAPLFGNVDLWCPLTSYYDHQAAEARRRTGERFWWYVCTMPKEPYCTLFIDHHGIELRTWIWQTWKYGVEGILVWQSNYWTSDAAFPGPDPQNPYLDPMSYRSGYGLGPGEIGYWGNGDGRFIYPPEAVFDNREPNFDSPVSSIRLEMLREGLEDYEYFWLLRELLEDAELNKAYRASAARSETSLTETEAPLKRTGIPPTAVPHDETAGLRVDTQDLLKEIRVLVDEARALLEVPPEVTASLTRFSTSPQPLLEHRARMAGTIVKLKILLETLE